MQTNVCQLILSNANEKKNRKSIYICFWAFVVIEFFCDEMRLSRVFIK